MKKSSQLDSRPSIVEFKDVEYWHDSDNRKKSWSMGPCSLDIKNGEVLGILGPSGSGKTTLIRLLAGLENPKRGTLTIDGNVVFDGKTNVRPEKRHVGMMFQDHVLFPHLSVRENILFGINDWNKKVQEQKLIELEKLLNLEGCIKRYPHELSGGQQQRVALARTLAPNPKVILLDEPLSNIDADLRVILAQELKDVLKQTNTTAIWVTHDRTEAFDVGDRIAVLKDGQLEQMAIPFDLYHNPKTRFVAEFIGQAAFVTGVVKNDQIMTEVGEIENKPSFAEGECVDVLVRPDDVCISPSDVGTGVIVKRQFRGVQYLYTIKLSSGKILLSSQPLNQAWEEGTGVDVHLECKHVVVFASDATDAT